MIYKKILLILTTATWPIWILPALIIGLLIDTTATVYSNLRETFGVK
jgi:hypothetical protein